MHRGLDYKWIVAIVVVFNSFMQYMDATIVNVALPTIGVFFHASATTAAWTTTAYLLSFAMIIPVSGWMGDRFGTKQIFIAGLVLFTLSSVLCALSSSIGSLVAFRVLQGAGAGALSPVGTAMLYRVFGPTERARVAAFVAVPTVVAPTVGPILGGWLVQTAGWIWIFTVNVPVGIIGVVMAAVLLRERVQPGEGSFDGLGFATATLGVGALVYGLQELGQRGLSSPSVLVAIVGGAMILVIFVTVELRIDHPMVNLRLFTDRLFTSGNVTQLFVQALFMGNIFLLPFLLQSQKGLPPLASGLVSFPVAVGVGMAVPLAARWYRAIGPWRLLLASMGLSIASSVGFIFVTAATGEWVVRALLLPRGWSFGLALVALAAATYARVSPQLMGRATALYTVVGQVGASLGVAFLASVLAARMAVHHALPGNPQTSAGAWVAFHETFAAAVFLAALGMAAAFLVSDKLAAASLQQDGQKRAEGGSSVSSAETAG